MYSCCAAGSVKPVLIPAVCVSCKNDTVMQVVLLVQVLLERCIHAGSTSDLGLSYPELNKAVEDPLSTHHSEESGETVLDAPLTMESAMHLHVPLSLLDDELDLSRHAPLHCVPLAS